MSAQLKYLRNHELREEIANLARIEPARDSWIKTNDKDREFKIEERRALARAVIGEVGPEPITPFCDRAIEQYLEEQTGHDLNAIIDAVVGIGMEHHGTSGQRGRGRRFNRDELKAILEYLEER